MVLPEYDRSMKAAVSLPDDLFASADELAGRLGVSRSELYARAVEEYVAKHRGENVTVRLNQVYAREDGALDPDIVRAQVALLRDVEW